MKRKCDYDINELTWDKAHKTNDQEVFIFISIHKIDQYSVFESFHIRNYYFIDILLLWWHWPMELKNVAMLQMLTMVS